MPHARGDTAFIFFWSGRNSAGQRNDTPMFPMQERVNAVGNILIQPWPKKASASEEHGLNAQSGGKTITGGERPSTR
jgi:hypothetical protein